MKLVFLHKVILISSFFALFFLDNAMAQPCVFSPPIYSVDTAGATKTVICNSNPLTLSTVSPTACPACTYLWSTGDTNAVIFAFTPGLYSVTVTDRTTSTTCVGVSATLDIKSSTLPAPIVAGDPFNICATPTIQNARLEVTNPCVTCSYQWYATSSATGIGGATQTRYATNSPNQYYVQVMDTLGCLEASNILPIGTAAATVPPLTTTTASLCDSNTATLSTINCIGCSYEWHYYDFLPENKLIISGVYDGTRPGNQPKGIELYAIGNIPNLSEYGLSVAPNGTGVAVSPLYTFPGVSLAGGSYIYIAENATEFTNFFGFPPNYTSSIMGDIDGNDAIKLYHNNNPVDLFGDEAYTSADYGCSGQVDTCYDMFHAHRSGWAYRNSNAMPTIAFDSSEWTYGLDSFVVGTTNGFWKTEAFPNGTFNGNSNDTTLDNLIITGVYDGTISTGGGLPIGIELKALNTIPDLSAYNIKVALDGTGGFGTAWSLPAGAVAGGTYIYVSSESVEFTNFFGFPPTTVPGAGVDLDQIDGNDCIALSYGATVIDKFGEETYIGAIPWTYTDGWVYRINGDSVNGGTFDINEWNIRPESFLPTNEVFGSKKIPIQTYTSNAAGNVLQVIAGADSSVYTTNITGHYTVEVQYPNSCIVESGTVLIDTSIFNPMITSEMPNLVGGSSTIISPDTAYLCFGSFVDLYMVGAYSLPPTWSYQWYKNGVLISGATGYNYTTSTAGLFSVEVTNEDGCIAMSNVIRVLSSTNGSNPAVSASSLYLCSESATSTLTTPPCVGCSYAWKTEDGSDPGFGIFDQSSYLVRHKDAPITGGSGARGYFIIVTDDASGCSYSSSIVEIKDTTYPAPMLTASGNTVCSATPIDLSTTPCAGCNYIWKIDSSGSFITYDSTQQYTFQIDSVGQYRVEVLYPNGCRTSFSNTIEATFQTVNANIITDSTSICNGHSVIIEALPDSGATCPGCSYQFLRDGVRMQITTPEDQQEISLAGDYQVIVTNAENCADTSDVPVKFTEVNIATSIRQSAKKICSSTSSVLLEVDSCIGCSYQWKIGDSTTLNNSTDTFYIVTGYSEAETYKVEVEKLGCIVIDSVVLDTVEERTIAIDINPLVSATPTICNGSAVQLVDTCQTCIDSNYYQYQWFYNGDSIAGASFESYQVDTSGTYYVAIVDTNGCEATSNSIIVQEFSPPVGFSLDFSALGPALPVTYGTFNLDDHLLPISLRNQGGYSSLTAGGAIVGDSINVGLAGSGRHFITYSYTDGNAQGTCVFSTYDTLEVLGAVAMDILNTKQTYLNIPSSEACLHDTLVITLTNFTFVPNEVIFVAGGGNTISVPVAPSLSVFAGVYSGSFSVVVPVGARTGKLTLFDGTNSYISPNFFVIQNPAVTIDLLSTAQPVCSNLDTVDFSGLPIGGVFSAHYVGMPSNPSLMVDSLLLLDSVTGYSSGVQNVMMLYTYTPMYTGTTITCRDSVQDSLLVEIRDVELDSVSYTPIAVSQTSESLANLTLITHPVSARDYPNNYRGTYVLGSSILPSTPIPVGVDTITYEIDNGGCKNASRDPIDIWPAPSLLDSIPTYLCSKDDTVFIQRNINDLEVKYRGQTIYSDALYTYSENINIPIGNPLSPDVRYSERINIMEITTSNGGVDSINYVAPNDTFYFVPSKVTSGATTITIRFKYSRTANFFSGGALVSTENTDYVIAEVTKQFLIEDPAVVAINPVIMADTVFCPENTNHQFLGFPAGGQYYISGTAIGYDSLANNIFNPTSYATGTAYGLTYVYTGQACVDSAYTGIYLPDPFSIAVNPNNGTGEYCATSPNDSIFFSLIPPVLSTVVIDTNSAQFFIGGLQSGTIFSPTQVGPPDVYNVRYVVSDIYGCPQEALDTFIVHNIPNLDISFIDSVYCLNDDTTQIHLSQIDTAGNNNVLTTWLGSGGIGYVQGETVDFTGNGIINGGNNPAMPYFYPMNAGVGVHAIRYVYADSNACMDSINFTVEVLPLPQVYMTTTGGAPLDSFYCENDSIPLYGFPIGTNLTSGYGSDTSILNGILTSLDSADKAFEPFISGTQPGILREVLYYYYEDNNGCRDTARYNVHIRNFTTDPTIAGLPQTVCASDLEIPVWADLHNGYDLDSLGWFTSSFTTGFSQLGATVNTDSIQFYPDSTNIVYANRDVILTFHYSDTSRSCFNATSDTVLVKALPHLTLSEQLVNPIQLTMDLLGSKLSRPPHDTFYHMCETAPEIPIYAYNTTGDYNPFTGLSLRVPDHISSDTGTYVLGRGVQSNMDPVNTAYGYIPALAGYGLDTIRYVYTDTSGCTDSIDHYIFVDSLPNLSFAGLSNYNSSINRYVYCQSDPDTPSISPAPIGVDWTMTFDGQNIGVPSFKLILDTLADPTGYKDYALKYNYIGRIYVSGEVCADSLMDTIQVRPSPPLAWVNVPTSYCMLDSIERLPLSATPYGGQFIDATNNFQVIAGIVGDSLFNPAAQPGKRDIYYYYLDTVSGCDDTIQHTIYVYNKPRISFDINGGCSGSQVEFIPSTAPYGLEYNSVAVDSITKVIWNFGDGVSDTIFNLPDTLVIPIDTHTYAGAGIFYPSLTVVNQGICDTTFMRRIIISPKSTPTDTVPYVQYFDNEDNGWMQESSDTTSINGIVQDSLWQWGAAIGNQINTQGNTVWGTRLAHQPTTYRRNENAWVYSPCFDLTSLDRPMIRLSIWRNTQKNVDGAVLQYHDNVTNTWEVLGKHGKGINWYQGGYVVSAPGYQVNTPTGWTNSSNGWEDARYRLDNIGNDLRQRTDVRFRIAFASSSIISGTKDGFAFDSVKIGNRTRNVLTEHFSGTGYPGIEQIEDQLYYTLFNNLYGRDVSLIQYHLNQYSNDALYLFNGIDNRERKLVYGVSDVNQVRIDGKNLVSKTSDLLGYPHLEHLDIESLKDPYFKLEFVGFPTIQYNSNSKLTTTIRVTALKDLPQALYAVHAVVTEDSLTTVTNHPTVGVMRYMYPDNTGMQFNKNWVAGETFDTTIVINNFNASNHDLTQLQVITFVQNLGSDPKEVYQVQTTRNLTRFAGPVDTLGDVSVEDIEGHPGYEVATLKLYPNPSQQFFNVAFEKALEADYEWQLIDVVGRVLDRGKVESGTELMQVETEGLTAGMYIFIVKNKTVYTQRKVIIQRY